MLQGVSPHQRWSFNVFVLLSFCATASVALAPSPLSAQRWSVSRNALQLGKGSDELFQSVRFGRLFPDGGAVIADVNGLFLRVYARDGAMEREFGRRGSGPGEFSSLGGVWLTPNGNIGAWDVIAQRYTILGRDGTVLSTQALRSDGQLGGRIDSFLGMFSNGDLLLGALKLERGPQPNEIVQEEWVLGRFSAAGEFRGSPGQILGMSRMYRAPLPFTPVPRVGIRNDSIWFNQGYEKELALLDRMGTATRKVALPWNPRSTANAWSSLESELRKLKKELLLGILPSAPRRNLFPTVGGLLVDDQGNFWIKEYDATTDALWLKGNALESGRGGAWRVLSPQGKWLAVVEVPSNMILLDIRGKNILGVERDELDVESVIVRALIKT